MALSKFSAVANAFSFAYGVNPDVQALTVVGGGALAGGTYSVTVALGTIALSDGRVVQVLATTAPITIGEGANAETVTPSAVSYAYDPLYGPVAYVTATFANAHGQGNQLASATFGLTEAVNYQHTLGGLVAVDGSWVQAGGVTGTITGNKGWANVTILDWRGTTTAKSYAATNGNNYAVTAISLY